MGTEYEFMHYPSAVRASCVCVFASLVTWFGAAGAAAEAVAVANAVPGNPGFRAPYTPASESTVLQEVPSTADPAVVRMNDLRHEFAAHPREPRLALQLAAAYVDYGRQIGDAHYAGYAEAVLGPWMTSESPTADVLVTQATILQYRHQFSEARDLLNRALKLESRHAQAWLTLATLDMVQGNYPVAAKDCVQVANSAGLELGLACTGNLRSYIGQARQSEALLRQAIVGATHATPAYRAWLLGLAAETAERLGDWPQAEAAYVDALKALPEDNFLLVAYADFLLDRGRPQEVLTLLAAHAQSDTAFLRIVLAEAALHRPEAQRDTWIMGSRFDGLAQRGSDYFGREQSRFALALQHDPATALSMAQRNWQVQRAPWDARIVLEAAAAAKDPTAATEVLKFLERTKLQDPLIEALAAGVRRQLSQSVP